MSWFDRNSLRSRIHWEGDALANMPEGNVIMERNVLDRGQWPTSDLITSEDNLGGGSFLDDQMKLTGSAHEQHFGRRGAQIAVPAAGQ